MSTKFGWDNVDGKCYTTPVKTQTGSTDRSYAYAMMDYLETTRLIQKEQDYNTLSDVEKGNVVGPVEEMAIDAEPRFGGESYATDEHVAGVTKTLDWKLRNEFDSMRVIAVELCQPWDPPVIIFDYDGIQGSDE